MKNRLPEAYRMDANHSVAGEHVNMLSDQLKTVQWQLDQEAQHENGIRRRNLSDLSKCAGHLAAAAKHMQAQVGEEGGSIDKPASHLPKGLQNDLSGYFDVSLIDEVRRRKFALIGDQTHLVRQMDTFTRLLRERYSDELFNGYTR